MACYATGNSDLSDILITFISHIKPERSMAPWQLLRCKDPSAATPSYAYGLRPPSAGLALRVARNLATLGSQPLFLLYAQCSSSRLRFFQFFTIPSFTCRLSLLAASSHPHKDLRRFARVEGSHPQQEGHHSSEPSQERGPEACSVPPVRGALRSWSRISNRTLYNWALTRACAAGDQPAA